MNSSDIVLTPEWVALDMINHFSLDGTIIDPCRYNKKGVFYKNMKKCDWAEINEGRDFHKVNKKYDWIVGNPPYSIYSDFMRHAMTIGDNILFLIPSNKCFNSFKMMREIFDYGGIVEMKIYGPGSKLKFPIGFCISAVHFKRGYEGDMKTTFYQEVKPDE